jgi:hypothetical protein
MESKTKYYFSMSDMLGGIDWHTQNFTWGQVLGSVTDANLNSEYAKTLLNKYILPEYFDNTIIIQNDDSTIQDDNLKRIQGCVYRWFCDTYPYYSLILSLYASNESKLMDKLKSITSDSKTSIGSNSGSETKNENNTTDSTNGSTTTGSKTSNDGATQGTVTVANIGARSSTTRSNDTPENGGDWSDDNHTSNIGSQSENAATDDSKVNLTTVGNASENSTIGVTGSQNVVAVANVATTTIVNNNVNETGTSSTESDPDTIMARLKEIRDKYDSVYAEWARGFEKFLYFGTED